MRVPFILAIVLTLAGCQSDDGGSAPTATATAASSTGFSDLVGAKGAGGETQLISRGYELSRTEGLTAYWWNDAEATCVRVVTADGRYQSVDTVPSTECGPLAGQATAAGSTAASTGASTAVGGPPPDIADMVGAKGGQAETGLNARGYAAARSNGLTTYWWNQSTGVCAQIVTADGRYKTIDAVPASNCKT